MKTPWPPCPACKRKGLHYANHPDAVGWKDTNKLRCRFCGKLFWAPGRAPKKAVP